MPDVKRAKITAPASPRAQIAPAPPVRDFTHRIFDEYQIKHVLDVGANIGGWIHAWLQLGATRVHALEPEPTSFLQIQKTFESDPRVSMHNLGVSDVGGKLENVNVFNCWTLKPQGDKSLDPALEFASKPPFNVELTTIDAFCTAWDFLPDFIKIDVDGYDAKALRGASAVIVKRRPVVMLEVSYLPFFVNDCCECMIRSIFELGYTITSVVEPGKIYKDAREFMRTYPWDTSYDVLLEPKNNHP